MKDKKNKTGKNKKNKKDLKAPVPTTATELSEEDLKRVTGGWGVGRGISNTHVVSNEGRTG